MIEYYEMSSATGVIGRMYTSMFRAVGTGSSLQDSIERVLEEMPADTQMLTMEVGIRDGVYRVTTGYRTKNNWSIVLGAEMKDNKFVAGEVKIVKRWGA